MIKTHCLSALALVLVAGAASFLPACAADSSSSGESESVGEAEQAICSDGAATSGVAATCGLVVWTTSPSATYGTADCPGEFVVDYGAISAPLTAEVAYADAAITNATTCQETHLRLDTFWKNANGSWHTGPIRNLEGKWDAPSGTCGFVFSGASTQFPQIPASSEVRLAAKAYHALPICMTSPPYTCSELDQGRKVKVTLVGPPCNPH